MNNRKPAKKLVKTAAKKPVAKKAITKAPAKKAAPKKAVKKAEPKKSATKKVVAKSPVKKAVVKAPAKKVVTQKAVAKPVVKSAVKTSAKAKPVAKPIAKPVAKPTAKPAVHFAAKAKKSVVKVAVKKTVKAPAAPKVIPIPKPAVVKSTQPKPVLPISVDLAARVLFKLRTEKVQLLDLRGHSDIADYFLIGTCSSEAQMQAILSALQREFKTEHVENLGVEYRAGVRWAVFDGVDVMVHIFEEGARVEYALDRLYRDGKQIELQAEEFLETDKGDSSDEELV